MRRRDLEPAAVAWALDEVVEGQLRQEPAHRLSDRQREYAWSSTVPNGIGVHVETVRRQTSGEATVEFDLEVGHSGTSVTELVYRHQIRPVVQTGATVMDRLFGAPPRQT